MAQKRLNPRLPKMHLSYTVTEIATLFSVHANTVRHWLKGGLEPLDTDQPLLVQGAVLRQFISDRRSSSKTPCPPGTLYCFKCRAPRRPALGMADFIEDAAGAGNLHALCEDCGKVMCRRVRREKLADILPGIEIQFARRPERIGECAAPRANCARPEEIESCSETMLETSA